jgi:hypothetical protein
VKEVPKKYYNARSSKTSNITVQEVPKEVIS